MAAFLSAAVALLRAIPALESIIRQILSECDAQRVRDAANRRAAKDAAVDASIDQPPHP